MPSLPPVDTQWRVAVAIAANKFFAIDTHPAIAEKLGKPDPAPPYKAFAVHDFVEHLDTDDEHAVIRSKIQPRNGLPTSSGLSGIWNVRGSC